MKSLGYISLVLLLAFSLLTGCETTRSITKSIPGVSSSSDELFAQVPAEERSQVQKAEFDLQVAEEELRLTEMKTELASLQKKYADYAEDVANEYRDEAEVGVELAKLEAIDRSGLGEKEKNINKIADLKAAKLKIQANRIKLEAKRDTTEQKINGLIKQVEEQETKIINLEAAGVPEPEAGDVMKAGEEPEEEKPSETKAEEPEKEPGEVQEQEKTESQQ